MFSFSSPIGPCLRATSASRAISSTSSRERPAPHGEGELHAHRQAVEDAGQRKADQGRRGGAAENDDEGVQVEEHPQVAAHHDQRDEDDAAEREPEAGGNIHEALQRTNGRDPVARVIEPSPAGLKDL